MKTGKCLSRMSADEILAEAISRENAMKDFYNRTVCEVGPEICAHIRPFISQIDARVTAIEELRAELETLREMTTAMAD